MTRRNWKNVRPTSLTHALELCKQYALAKHNLSEQRIAERMGLPNHWVLYKWLANGRMPAVMIPVYEAACGCHYVTQWLAASAGKLAIDMPTGKACDATDIQELQVLLNATTGALLAFHAGQQGTDQTLATIQCAMESLGWHHGNVAEHMTPQLDLGEHDDD